MSEYVWEEFYEDIKESNEIDDILEEDEELEDPAIEEGSDVEDPVEEYGDKRAYKEEDEDIDIDSEDPVEESFVGV